MKASAERPIAKPGRPKRGAARPSPPKPRQFTLDDYTDELISRLAHELDPRRPNRSEIVRRAVWSYTKDGRNRLFAEHQATIDGLRAENDALRREIRAFKNALDRRQKKIGDFLDERQRVLTPEATPEKDGDAKEERKDWWSCVGCQRRVMPTHAAEQFRDGLCLACQRGSGITFHREVSERQSSKVAPTQAGAES